MSLKNLIIGAFTGYTFDQLKPWVKSIDEFGFVGDKVLIVGNTDDATIKELNDRNFKLIFIDPTHLKDIPIHVLRFIYIYDYLRQFHTEYDSVLTTDVKDVYFQQNPFEYLLSCDYYSLIVGSEGLKYKDEPWGSQNLFDTFGPYIYGHFSDNVIYNVGVLIGGSEYVKDLCLNIYLSAINRPIPIVDQAVFNMLIQTQPYKEMTLFSSQDDGFICHAGTTADSSKIDAFRPNLLDNEPIFKDDIVQTKDEKPFYIVHQYDRIPEWKKFVEEKYE